MYYADQEASAKQLHTIISLYSSSSQMLFHDASFQAMVDVASDAGWLVTALSIINLVQSLMQVQLH